MRSICLTLLMLLSLSLRASDADMTSKPFVLITVTTSAAFTVKLTKDHEYTIVHLGLQSDGSTASATTDTVVVQNSDAVSAANMTDGTKLPVFSRSVAVVQARDVSKGADGLPELQLKATGTGCKVLILKGQRSPP